MLSERSFYAFVLSHVACSDPFRTRPHTTSFSLCAPGSFAPRTGGDPMTGFAEADSVPVTTITTGTALERSTLLGPDDPFPEELLGLSLEQLQILHSRICRQLELEYLTDPEGRHPITADRLHELQIEFASRLLR